MALYVFDKGEVREWPNRASRKPCKPLTDKVFRTRASSHEDRGKWLFAVSPTLSAPCFFLHFTTLFHNTFLKGHNWIVHRFSQPLGMVVNNEKKWFLLLLSASSSGFPVLKATSKKVSLGRRWNYQSRIPDTACSKFPGRWWRKAESCGWRIREIYWPRGPHEKCRFSVPHDSGNRARTRLWKPSKPPTDKALKRRASAWIQGKMAVRCLLSFPRIFLLFPRSTHNAFHNAMLGTKSCLLSRRNSTLLRWKEGHYGRSERYGVS